MRRLRVPRASDVWLNGRSRCAVRDSEGLKRVGDDADRHLERFDWRPSPGVDLGGWPFTIPAVAQVVSEGGIDIPPGVTFLVGENGSGKSTLVEAMAASYPRRGAVGSGAPGLVGVGPSAEDSPLGGCLRARAHPMASPAGFFLRAESMHAFLGAIDATSGSGGSRVWGGRRMQEQSHGESFLEVLRQRFTDLGVYFLDEPEAALSFQSCLGMVALLDVMAREGSQVVVATHSPLLLALPGATLLELGEWGIRQTTYDDAALVQHWRDFLAAPPRYLRHLLAD